VYEEYGANFELVQRDVDEIQRAITAWPEYDRAIEVLSAHVNPVKSREANRRKALTIKDLLIKVSEVRVVRSASTDCHSPADSTFATI
jgi:hypothetical protein